MRRSQGLIVLASVFALIAGCAGSTHRVLSSSTAPRTLPPPTGTPPPSAVHPSTSARPAAVSIDAQAFRGRGRLAVVCEGRLFVVDGGTGTTHEVRTSAPVATPVWSHDGRYLAFLTVTAAGASAPESALGGSTGKAWLVPAAGGAPVQVASSAGELAWSPTQDVLGLVLAPTSTRAASLVTVRPGTSAQQRAVLGVAGTFAWAPDGRQFAYTDTVRHGADLSTASSSVTTMRADGTSRVARYRVAGSGLALAGWWPDGHGLVFWEDPQFSSSLAADGMDLFTLAVPGRQPRRLTTTLGYRSDLAFGSVDNTVTVVAGAGRQAWTDKTLQLCLLSTGQCSAPPAGPAGSAALASDPAAVPGSSEVSFVSSPDEGSTYGGSASDLAAWTAGNQLWTWGYTGGNPHRITAASSGVSSPRWSRDAQHLLYVAEDSLWLLTTTSGSPPVRIAGPLYGSDPPSYYGTFDWATRYAWHG